MAEINPPYVLQGGTVNHPALLFRRPWESILFEGVGKANSGSNDMKVEQNGTPNMSVNVLKGEAWVKGDDVTNQGLYYLFNDATKNLSIAAADATNPRKDLIVARVKDDFHGQVGDTWTLEVITGTPAASPAEPTLPATALKLAVVDVAAGATSITNANITDSRPVRNMTIPQVLNAASRPTGIPTGQVIYNIGTGEYEVYNGSAWTPFVVFQPAVKIGQNSVEDSNVTLTGSFQDIVTATFTKPAAWAGYELMAFGSVYLPAVSGATSEFQATIVIDGVAGTNYNSGSHNTTDRWNLNPGASRTGLTAASASVVLRARRLSGTNAATTRGASVQFIAIRTS